jgi:hypothetical protein
VTILTVTPARSLGDLKARIANELARDDLSEEISLAIDDAIDEASSHRFWFNEVAGETLNLNPGQSTYNDADIDAIIEIDNLYLLVGTQRRTLRVVGNARMNGLYDGNPSQGEPYLFSRYGTALKFYPTPQQAYAVVFDGLSRGDPMEDDSDANVWTTYGEKYVRALAKRELYLNIIRDADKAVAMDKLAQRYREDLLYQTESRMTTGEMAAYG